MQKKFEEIRWVATEIMSIAKASETTPKDPGVPMIA